MNLSRRVFITSAALAPVACGVPLGYERGMPIAQPQPLPTVRPPRVGQEWTYIKRNVFDGKTLGVVTERVVSVDQAIVIQRFNENGDRLPDEIQGPWGFASKDPHWGQVLNFSPAIPLWPESLSATWNKQISSKYSIAGNSDSMYSWLLYMSAHGWEKITVPAGQFTTLRYQCLINYENRDPDKVNCIRKETAWFAPALGRWIARETSGTYNIQGQIEAEILEDSVQWQLVSTK